MDSKLDPDGTFEKARNHLAALTSAHVGLWHIDEANWSVDQDTGLITWSFADGTVVTAPFQVVGTYNMQDGTFLWGWDHPSIDEDLRHDAQAVLEFAKEHGIEFMQQRKIECTEAQAWDFTALATLICERQGAYRGPAGSTHVFVTFDKITMSKR